MRVIKLASCLLFLLCASADIASSQPAPDGDLRIVWEVKNRFRLFRNEADFERHVAAHRGDGVLASEHRLAAATNGRGWARDMLDGLCLDQTGKIVDTCQRDGERESYLAPREHRISALLTGTLPPQASCAWTFQEVDNVPRQVTSRCDEEINARLHFGRPTIVTVDVAMPDQTTRRATTEILVRDYLIAGIGDSIAAGEGNPDRPVALADSGFCFRRFGGGEEYFRPGRAGYRGDKACDAPDPRSTAGGERDWARHGARWVSAACHRSLYGHQMRTALALAVENPQIAVTFLPLACSGATIEAGLFKAQRARECPPAPAACIRNVPPQLQQLQDALAQARRQMPERRLDLVLLTIGANDILFSGLVADVIIEAPAERALLTRGGTIASVADAQRHLDTELPGNFVRLRAALKPLVGGDLARVVYVSYGHPALQGGQPCPGGRHGFDVHPAFGVDPNRLRQVADFVSDRFLPRIKDLARCEGGTICREPSSDVMTFVDGHQQAFEARGFCARSSGDPVFDRECFSERGESFSVNPVVAATDPMACSQRPSEFRPYAARARWIRTANDSYFTAMTFPEGLPATVQPSDIHDATWGATSAVYGGAIHPTAEGHAAMADAALPAVRETLGLSAPTRP
jgi:lysophospholipase L1-like esterase